jgi:hypothetical protein
LPELKEVWGKLDLSGLSNFKALPKLQRAYSLLLVGTGLTSLPELMSVQGNLILNQQMKFLPKLEEVTGLYADKVDIRSFPRLEKINTQLELLRTIMVVIF